jgi:phosphopantothenoylcysteine decarboxylase / phosphopantothenate---cysteine ligase
VFKGKTVVIGVTGGIAAYKAAYLTSALKNFGADVHVCMTKNASEFIDPLTFEVLSNNPIYTDTFDRARPWEVEHISLAKKADLFVVAPATANIIAKLANGLADDMLSTTLLACKCPIIIAPAMNTNMLENPATQHNIATLINRGFFVMDTEAGMLACGDIGYGRMKDPEQIIDYCENVLTNKDLIGKNILITAGPTREKIDAVRYITNPSSGKMGYALADRAVKRGANVTLISGPVNIQPPYGAKIIDVTSASEMQKAVQGHFADCDVIIMSAAVADYTPKHVQENKMKKSGDMRLELVRTADILHQLGKTKQSQLLIGFAAETDDIESNALSKLENKNLDMIALNDLTDENSGFGKDTNHVYLYKKNGDKIDLGLNSKAKIADLILDETQSL